MGQGLEALVMGWSKVSSPASGCWLGLCSLLKRGPGAASLEQRAERQKAGCSHVV